MKTFFATLLSLCIALLYTACTTTSTQPTAQAIPALLKRSAQLGSPEEQAFVVNEYTRLKEALKRDPMDHKARLRLAELFIVEARVSGEHGHYYPAALTQLDYVLAQQIGADLQFQALTDKTSVLLSQHQFTEALETGRQALALNSYNALIYGALVDANVELGDYPAAISMADKMTSIRPDIRSYARVSYLREIHGDLPGAIEAMQMAAAAGFPGYEDAAWCKLQLGGLYEKQGDLSRAEATYQAILTERPAYPFALGALAGIRIKQTQYREAEQLLRQAGNIIPEVGFYQQLAALYLETDRAEAAAALTDSVLQMLRDDEASGHRMNLEFAEVYLDLKGDAETALTYAMQEYALRPNNVDVNRMMAMIHLKRGDAAAAAPYLAVAARTGSRMPELLCLQGIYQAQTGNLAEGKKLIRAAFSADPFLAHSLAEDARALAGV
ncbi:MAG: hypothetical protein SF053_17125 [Bacteroidia bacterium]|nr:hypothetical protein [Bacteroidia bacterium]